MTDVLVTMEHLRKMKICSGGGRRWFKTNGLSWTDFLENGISADTLDATGDALATHVADFARREAADGQ